MPAMATTDNGYPVNHHLEAHIYDKTSGAVVSSVTPAITITDEASGATRTVDDVAAMYDIQAGQNDLHFGNNVYLPDGTYTVQVTVGPESAQFMHVAVSGGAGLSTTNAGSAPADQSMAPNPSMQSMP
jgi:hypothetical protein